LLHPLPSSKLLMLPQQSPSSQPLEGVSPHQYCLQQQWQQWQHCWSLPSHPHHPLQQQQPAAAACHWKGHWQPQCCHHQQHHQSPVLLLLLGECLVCCCWAAAAAAAGVLVRGAASCPLAQCAMQRAC